MIDQSSHPCPTCGGRRKLLGFFPVYAADFDGERVPAIELDCQTCQGTGTVGGLFLERRERGELLKRRRIAAGYGLRQFAELIGILPSDLANAEQGRTDPDTIDTKGLLGRWPA